MKLPKSLKSPKRIKRKKKYRKCKLKKPYLSPYSQKLYSPKTMKILHLNSLPPQDKNDGAFIPKPTPQQLGFLAEEFVATHLNCFKCNGKLQQLAPNTKYIDFKCKQCKFSWQLKVSMGSRYFGKDYITVSNTGKKINILRVGDDGFNQVCGYICILFVPLGYSFRVDSRNSFAVFPKSNLVEGDSVYEHWIGCGFMGKDKLTFIDKNVEKKRVKCNELLDV